MTTAPRDARIAALEAALRQYADPKNWRESIDCEDDRSGRYDLWWGDGNGFDLARRALGMKEPLIMHTCPICGSACYCNGDIDDIMFDDDSDEALNCTCCPEGEPAEPKDDDEDCND